MPVKILSVDDSKTVRIIVNKAFKTYDCVITEAANGVEGLAAANRDKPDLILLDITMPVMDGVEMLTKLKSDPALKAIPVIMLTAEGGRDQVLKIAKLGIRDYVVKPFKEEILVDKVSKVFDLKPKDSVAQKAKTIFDSANVLIVDEKPAIIQQLQDGLKHTPWKIQGASSTGEAMDLLSKSPPDLMILSLSLAEDGGFTLFRLARQNPKTKACPVFGLSVKTDVEVHQKALQSGFNQIVTKPIDLQDVEMKVTRALNLDTSPKYFSITDGVCVIRFPETPTAYTLGEIATYLRPKVSEAVNSGIGSAVIDLQGTKGLDMAAIKLVMQILDLMRELSLAHVLLGNQQISADCRGFEDTSSWKFQFSMADAKAALAK